MAADGVFETIVIYIAGIAALIFSYHLVMWLLFKGWLFKVGGGLLIFLGILGLIQMKRTHVPDPVAFYYGLQGLFIILGLVIVWFDRYILKKIVNKTIERTDREEKKSKRSR